MPITYNNWKLVWGIVSAYIQKDVIEALYLKGKALITGIIYISLIIGIRVPYLNQPAISIREEQPQIVSHTSYLEFVENVTFYVVAGVIENTLKTNIASVNVSATFYDAENKLIGTRETPAELEILKPNQRVPFRIYLLVNSTTVITDINYEFTLEYVETIEEPIEGLVILNQTPSIDKDGYYIISGEVQHQGSMTAHAVKLLCTYYDSDGNVLAVSHADVSAVMDPDETRSFKISSKPHKITPASYELLIIVGRYRRIPIQHYLRLFVLILGIFLLIAYMKKRRGW